MENTKNKKSVKFQGDMLNFCDFIQVFVFTRNHHLNIFTINHIAYCLQNYSISIMQRLNRNQDFARVKFTNEQLYLHKITKTYLIILYCNISMRYWKNDNWCPLTE